MCILHLSALIVAAQPYSDNYYQAPKPQRSNATSSSTRQSASTRYKGKEVAKPITPQSESVSEEDSDPEQAQRDKEMQKNSNCIYQTQRHSLNKTILKQLKKANASVTQELEKCKTNLDETNSALREAISCRDSCLIALQ
ncbi:hypothetical protein Tco_0298269, partial [Tanacetum coccineum]